MSQRIGCIQPARRLVDFRIDDSSAVLACVDQHLDAISTLIEQAGKDGCDAVVLPEDTLGLEHWSGVNEALWAAVLPIAVERMNECLGALSARHAMYVVCCSDALEDGHRYNTAFLLGRDGQPVGRYRKVNMPYSERGGRAQGDAYPVFETPDLGGIGLLICYDMVFPEAIRCLALNGADIVFVPTLGGACMGGGADMNRAAFRTRAVDNWVYLAVAQRGGGSLIIAPDGGVLQEGGGPDEIIIADIDPRDGRQGGNAFDWQQDMRARLFRERVPHSYAALTMDQTPALRKLPNDDVPEEITRRCSRVLTVGEEAFRAADALRQSGQNDRAKRAFEQLCEEYKGSWIERIGRERIAQLA